MYRFRLRRHGPRSSGQFTDDAQWLCARIIELAVSEGNVNAPERHPEEIRLDKKPVLNNYKPGFTISRLKVVYEADLKH